MVRESNDPIVIQSSIALLQERFRQLQRVKEMREERELHKMVTEPKLLSPSMQYDYYEPSSRLVFHFLPIRTSTPLALSSPQAALPIWSNSLSEQQLHDDLFHQCMETRRFMSLRPRSETIPTSSMLASAKKFESTPNYHDEEVDTSLRL